MRFKIDENLPREFGEELRIAGHEAHTVHDEGLSGADDGTIAEKICEEQRALISLDLDFSDIRNYSPATFPGIILLRSKAQDKKTLLWLLRRLIPLFESEPLAGRLWIVESDRIRIRGET